MSTLPRSVPFMAPQRLSLFILEQAAWRSSQSRRFPEDKRNESAALALQRLAAYVDGLPTTDRQLVQLMALGAFSAEGEFTAGQGANVRRVISRFGFDRENDEPDQVLHELFVAVAEDRKVRKRDNVLEVDGPHGRVTVTLEPSRDRAPEEREILAEVMILAASHDRVCVNARVAVERAIGGYRNPRSSVIVERDRVSDALVDLTNAIAHLAAAVAPKALPRLDLLASFGATTLAAKRVAEMVADEREQLLRPIFEDAGIQTRFLTTDEASALYAQGERAAE